jgi:hypothetical protein
VPAPSIQLPNQDAEYVTHIALDIGGSLIKLVYFSTDPHEHSGGEGYGTSPSTSPEPSAAGSLMAGSTRPPMGQRGGAWEAVRSKEQECSSQ